MTDGEKKARILVCKQWEVTLNKIHGQAWYVTQNARTANVHDIAQELTAVVVVIREIVRQWEREALDGLPAGSVGTQVWACTCAGCEQAREVHGRLIAYASVS